MLVRWRERNTVHVSVAGRQSYGTPVRLGFAMKVKLVAVDIAISIFKILQVQMQCSPSTSVLREFSAIK